MPNTLNILQGSSVDYKLFKCELPQRNQSIKLNCSSDEEAAKLFGMYFITKVGRIRERTKSSSFGREYDLHLRVVACQKQTIC